MPILIDLHPAVISAVAVNLKDDQDHPNLKGLIKHTFFNMILGMKMKFSKDYGNVIICTDSKTYWRKDYFRYYKGDRAAKKKDSGLNWEYIEQAIDELKVDLRDNFKYKVIEVEGAEADDVIGVLTKYFQTNELVSNGLFGESPQPVLIISGDGDFYQLQKYQNVNQWSARFKKFVGPENLHNFIIEHIVKAGDDGIPNILSPDNSIVDKIRQIPIKKPYLAKFIEHGKDACTTDMERRNWDRNRTLVDFDFIPQDIADSIIFAYTKYEVRGNRTKIMNYFINNNMMVLYGDSEHF